MQSPVMRNNALLLLPLLLPYLTTGSMLSQEYIDTILQYHDIARESVQPRAADMQTLVYDDRLEDLASTWAQKCIWGHPGEEYPQFDDYGQNIAYASLREPFEVLMMSLNGWWVEKVGYRIETDECEISQCAHYTQMIWGNTSKIGCAFHRCDSIVGNGQRTFFWVCQYWPRGNWIGTDRYEAGKSCSKCRPGQICRNRQCSDK